LNVDISGVYDTVEQDIAALSLNVTTISTNLNALDAEVEQRYSSLYTGQLNLISGLSNLDAEVDQQYASLHTVQTDLTNRVTTNENDIDSLQTSVAALQLIDTVETTHPGAVELNLSGNKLTINAPFHGFQFTTDQTPPTADIGNLDDIN